MLLSRKNALTLTLFTLATALTAQIHAAGTLRPAHLLPTSYNATLSISSETRNLVQKVIPASVVAIPGTGASLAFCLVGPFKLIKSDKSISDSDVYAPTLAGLVLAGATCWLVSRILQQEDTQTSTAKSTPPDACPDKKPTIASPK